jgi:ResB-like family protein
MHEVEPRGIGSERAPGEGAVTDDDRTGLTRAATAREACSFSLSFAILLVVWVLGVVFQTFWTPITVAGNAAAIFLGPLAALTLALIVFGRRFLPLLASYRFSLALLISLTTATAAGTLVLQRASASELQAVYGSALAGVVRFLFLDDVFHAFWFNGLLVLVAVVLVVVVIRKRPVAPAQIGFYSAHLGIVIILLGAFLGSLFGVEGILELTEGRTARTLVLMENGRKKFDVVHGHVHYHTRDLGFEVRLESFEVDYYPDLLKLIAFRLREKETVPIGSYEVDPGAPAIRVPGTPIRVRVVAHDPASDRVDLEVETEAGTGRIVVAPDRPIRLPGGAVGLTVFRKPEPEAREYLSRVAILEGGKRVREGVIVVNQPLAHRGYQFYQFGYDPERPGYTSLHVRCDPGLPVVFLGFVVLGFGALHFLFRTGVLRRRRVIQR